MQIKHPEKFKDGITRLQNPVLPLIRLVQLLFVTTQTDNITSLVDELVEPIELESVTYTNPKDILKPYIPILQEFKILKHGGKLRFSVVDENKKPVDLLPALEAWVLQQIVTKELETINSLLCGPCNCDLCCVGPDSSMEQAFFEIPLLENEVELFTIQKITTELSRQHTPYDDNPLNLNGLPFYVNNPAIYHWRTGWSMILPSTSKCPHLELQKKYCTIYPQRPDVCRRPQIFCYILERLPENDRQEQGEIIPAYMLRNSLLAVWDCPYVQELQDEIAQYAATCQLEIYFRKNKE